MKMNYHSFDFASIVGCLSDNLVIGYVGVEDGLLFQDFVIAFFFS